ncbi:unnamed protein product [Alopecurus aequalis]
MAAAPPALPIELVEEILLRLPPDDPACLLRASVVCKTWGGAVSSPGFRRRLHELHPTPPVLGFLHNWRNEHIPLFFPTTISSFSLAAPDRRRWRVVDCRHGRALFLSKDQRPKEILVWEPISGAQRRVPLPAAFGHGYPNAAVFCAADGCGHHDCHGGPFHLVFVFSVDADTGTHDYVTSACLYSSETGAWGEPAWMHGDFDIEDTSSGVLLVGRSVFYFLSDDGRILGYDLARHGLTLFDPPESEYYAKFSLILAEDGGLGLSQALYRHIKLWSWKASDGTNAQWVLSRVIYLENLLPNGALVNAMSSLYVLGFAEGANLIFVTTVVGVFTIEIQSHRVRKVCDVNGLGNLIPVVSFYTPLPCGAHQDSPRVPCYEKVGASMLKNTDVPCYPKLKR